MKELKIIRCWIVVLVMALAHAYAGVDKPTQERYKRRYENKTLFLKVPVRWERQVILVGTVDVSVTTATEGDPVKFKVGDQVRVLGVNFGRSEIRFKIASLQLGQQSELVFKFPSELTEGFSESDAFNATLNKIFTEGLTYREIDSAKEGYLKEQFDRIISELAASSNVSRDFVLQSIVERIPSYAAAKKDVENVMQKNRELNEQIQQLTSKSKKLELEQKQSQTEANRLKDLIQAVQSELGSARGAGIVEEIRHLKRQLSSVQKTLSSESKTSKDLARQVDELTGTFKQLEKDKAALDSKLQQLNDNYEKSRQEIDRLTRENTDLKSESSKLNRDLKALTAKEGSLAQQYLSLQKEKDNMEDLLSAFKGLRSERIEETSEDGYVKSWTRIKLNDTPIGIIESVVPREMKPGERKRLNVRYTAESIDYIKLSEAERKLFNSLGKKFKIGHEISTASDDIKITPLKGDAGIQEVSERSSSTWEWEVANEGSQNTELTLRTFLVNKNEQKIPVFHYRVTIPPPDIAKKLKGYMQPIPITLGAVFGFILFGIAGAFRRSLHGRGRSRLDKVERKGDDYIVDKKL